VDIIYVDFAKAFDSVVLKLMSYGIGGCLLSSISIFPITDRNQYVCIDGFYSSTVRVVRGVPQGSVLGPILFIIFTNDVCDIIVGNTTYKPFFADDIKLHASVDFNGISHDIHTSLDNLMLWSNMWQLKVNINKCNFLRIGKNCVLGDYSFNCDVLPRVEKVADLGIIVSKNFAISDYLNECTSKAFVFNF